LEKFSGYSGINSAISDLAAIISTIFTKAGTQNPFTSSNFRT